MGAAIVEHNALRENGESGIHTTVDQLDGTNVLENTLFLNDGFGIVAAARTGLARNVINSNFGTSAFIGRNREMDDNVCNSDKTCP